DLERAQAITRTWPTERTRFQRDRRAPAYLDFDPPPLQVTLPCHPLPVAVGRFATEAQVDVTIFDFGAFSVDYRVPFEGPLEDLARLASALYDDVGVLGAARARGEELTEALAPALTGECDRDVYEQYVVFDFEHFEPARPAHALLEKAELRHALAQILRAEERPLSESRVEDALRLATSYTPDDLLVVDWSTAVAVGGSADERLVLEFANTELLELRHLDKRLDRDLEEASRALSRPRRWIFGGADLRRVAKLQVEGAMLYEAVNNAVSLLGDQWLAEVYARIAERYALEKWQKSVANKLASLESIYQKLADESAVRRSELLELIIIGLIALEISWGSLFAGLRESVGRWLGAGP
ncbi:MAG: hypothetical protein ACREI8_14185, partial [Myxococcota bacterium]